MIRKLLILWITAGLLMSACQTDTAGPLTPSGQRLITAGAGEETGHASTGSRAVTTAPPKKSTKPAATAPAATYPTAGILSDAAEYDPGNPKTHALIALEPDTTVLPDKTRPENQVYRSIFNEYLKINYPEQQFRVVSIEDYQHQGVTYKKAQAYSNLSTDINLTLYYDGVKLFDSFQKDVVSRQNTMNRWRFEFRRILDPISRKFADRDIVNLDVSYDYYKENIEQIKLDQVLDPKSTVYRRCLEMYFNSSYTDPQKVSDTALKIYQEIQAGGYSFQEYFIYLEDTAGGKTAFKVPLELIGSPAFPAEMHKAMMTSHPDNLIQKVAPYNP